MANTEATLNTDRHKLYTSVENILSMRGDYRVTERIKDTSVYAVGRKSFSTGTFVGVIVIGILAFLFLNPYFGILVFLGLTAYYATLPNDTIQVAFYSEEDGRTTVSITYNGKVSAKVGQMIGTRLQSYSNSENSAPEENKTEESSDKKNGGDQSG